MRLRNVQTGVVVSCSDETATRLGAGWEPADQTKPEKKPAAASRTAAKK